MRESGELFFYQLQIFYFGEAVYINLLKMKNFLKVCLLICLLGSCNTPTPGVPEPHLELGQRITFVGAEPEKTYVVVGYRHLLEDKTDKNWSNHDYIVISYSNDQGDIKVATIHRNSILKR